ncbi:MAG: HlyC/CorC family transporter [Proteobacteria bacterium]|jgi:Mg2+/Co2+ transporter CorB|nr:HlyC/CorC family transporter [Pseudomonadota bacterium]
MDDIALTTLGIALAILLVMSAFFSMAETAMMAANRYRMKHQALRGARGARLALALLARTDRLLGVILLGNNLINAASATLATIITVRLFGEGRWSLALGTVAVTFLILVFSEITPKVIGAAYADRLAPLVSFALAPLLRVTRPVVWFVNLFVHAMLKVVGFRPATQSSTALSQEELRSLVLEGAQYFRGKQKTMLANLLDLEAITVDDVMTPRSLIHALDLSEKPELLRQQLATSYHTRMPVYDGTLDNIVGILAVKSLIHLMNGGELDSVRLRPLLRPAYFVPLGTPLLTQLQQFQVDRQRMALVVDEYGELQGLVTIEDLIEEIVGEFTTQAPGGAQSLRREPDGSVVVDGMVPLRTLNRRLGTRFTLDGPKTLNGLIVEHLGEIPDAGLSFEIDGQRIEVLQTQDRAVKVVKLLPPVGGAAAPLQSPVAHASS